ncbi:MAG: hypothetical protein KAT06_07180 [Gammaproteobacteria bacterium]|nr:hypothetical protein [Gammaproteobacteria bacterium]
MKKKTDKIILVAHKRSITIAAFVIIPLLLLSLGSALSSLTRIYVNSGEFLLSIFLGGLLTSLYYGQFIHNNMIKIIFVISFGILTPVLFINAAQEIYGSGIQEHSGLWSPIYFLTTLIGVVEIILYTRIILLSLFKSIIKLFSLISILVRKVIFIIAKKLKEQIK